ncbi:MAG: PD-(D/E)XK nuclease family protein, partial [Paracoccaceae bacterium]
ARRMWRARLARVADWLIAGEAERRAEAMPVALEKRGSVQLENGFVLTAEADRIDRRADGRLVIYDYKTGTPPTPKQMDAYDKQLLLEAAMAERGGFEGLDPAEVDHVAYIGLGATPKFVANALQDGLVGKTWAGLGELIEKYRHRNRGYMARRVIFSRQIETDYDHLSRYGEWDESQTPLVQEVGE